jgi:hypothetical protein
MTTGRIFDMLTYNGFNLHTPTTKCVTDEFELIDVMKGIMSDRRAVDFIRLMLNGQKNIDVTALAGSKVGI